MTPVANRPLAELTTLRLGGPAERLFEVESEAELIDLVRELDAAGRRVLVLGGGSNLVICDDGFDGDVIRIRTRGLEVESHDDCSGVTVQVAAGEDWDGFVRHAIDEGWAGVEALSGIPGLAGAAPMQNVGAYGQEVADTIARVVTWDRQRGAVRTLAAAECGFGYRTSRFKQDPERYVVLRTVFQLRPGELGGPIRYAELARRLGVEPGDRAPLPDVREAVLQLRRSKGMVLEPGDHDTWSAGSFFTNPVLAEAVADDLPDGAPRWHRGDGQVKTSAAWLIEHAGFGKGYRGEAGPVALSSKHTLALTNRGDATTKELLVLAREIRDGVRAQFGVDLVPEPTLVGCTL